MNCQFMITFIEFVQKYAYFTSLSQNDGYF